MRKLLVVAGLIAVAGLWPTWPVAASASQAQPGTRATVSTPQAQAPSGGNPVGALGPVLSLIHI